MRLGRRIRLVLRCDNRGGGVPAARAIWAGRRRLAPGAFIPSQSRRLRAPAMPSAPFPTERPLRGTCRLRLPGKQQPAELRSPAVAKFRKRGLHPALRDIWSPSHDSAVEEGRGAQIERAAALFARGDRRLCPDADFGIVIDAAADQSPESGFRSVSTLASPRIWLRSARPDSRYR